MSEKPSAMKTVPAIAVIGEYKRQTPTAICAIPIAKTPKIFHHEVLSLTVKITLSPYLLSLLISFLIVSSLFPSEKISSILVRFKVMPLSSRIDLSISVI